MKADMSDMSVSGEATRLDGKVNKYVLQKY